MYPINLGTVPIHTVLSSLPFFSSTLIFPLFPLLTDSTIVLSHPTSILSPTTLHPPKDTFWWYSAASGDDFRHFLASYSWSDSCFTFDIAASVSNSTDIILQWINRFAQHYSKPGKLESPKWFNQAFNHVVPLKLSAFRH